MKNLLILIGCLLLTLAARSASAQTSNQAPAQPSPAADNHQALPADGVPPQAGVATPKRRSAGPIPSARPLLQTSGVSYNHSISTSPVQPAQSAASADAPAVQDAAVQGRPTSDPVR